MAVFPERVEFALFWHDAIYDTKARDNERKSAWLAYNTAFNKGLSRSFALGTYDLIMETQHKNISKLIDGRLIADLDLLIFGQPRRKFDLYENNIRKEFSWVSDIQFNKGRRTFLEKMLKREIIYNIPEIREKYEARARENLERSISVLQ